MISVFVHFIPFIFKICQINVGIDMISWFHNFFISNFSADFFSFAQLCAAANDGSRLSIYIKRRRQKKKMKRERKQTLQSIQFVLGGFIRRPFSREIPSPWENPQTWKKKVLTRFTSVKMSMALWQQQKRGAKWGEVKRNFFPPSRNSIPLVEKRSGGFFRYKHGEGRLAWYGMGVQRYASKL